MDTNQQLISLLQHDQVCVIPTDTVYGVIGRLNSRDAVAKIYSLKHRDPTKPVGTILAASIEQIIDLTTPSALQAAAAYWPGSVSVILPASDDYTYAHKGTMSLAIRVPDSQELRALLEQTGPLASSALIYRNSLPQRPLPKHRHILVTQCRFILMAATFLVACHRV